jgi:hypothetical protein
VEVLAFPGCPNRDAAIALAERVCAELESDAEIRVRDICNQQAADQARSLGSPTIRVDGRDVEPGAEHCFEYLHTCRLYQGEHSLGGLPEEAWVRQALQDAQARRRAVDLAAVDAEITGLLDQASAADGDRHQAEWSAVRLFRGRGVAPGDAGGRARHRPDPVAGRHRQRVATVRQQAGAPRPWHGLIMRDGETIRTQASPDKCPCERCVGYCEPDV